MLPTPDCSGSSVAGQPPVPHLVGEEVQDVTGDQLGIASGGLNGVLRSGRSVGTTATIFSGGQRR